MAPAAPVVEPITTPDIEIPAAPVDVPTPTATPTPGQHNIAVQPAAALTAPKVLAPKAFQPAAVPEHPAVVVASPAAASANLATIFSNVLNTLSTALNSGGRPTVPADATLALMLATARRATAPTLLAAAKSTTSTAAITTTASATSPVVEAEKMRVSGAGRVVYDRSASGKYSLMLNGRGKAETTVSIPESAALKLRLRAASGAPNMTLSIDGVPYTTLMVNSTSYADYTFVGGISPGTRVISISSTTATKRNMLYVDKVTISSGPIVEEFIGKSGSAPSSIWTRRSGTGFDSSPTRYDARNAVLDGKGNLAIRATRGKNSSYTSGWVWTKNNMTFGYGTMTARIKMPKGQGLWPAVWLMGADSDTVGWPASGEVDIAELPSTTTTVYSTLHGPIAGTSATQQAQIVSNLPDVSTDYHNYWVTRLPNKIIFGFDDQTLGTLTPADLGPGETWVYNRPMYFIMNLAVGGPWAGAPNSSTPATAQMLVDSVTFVPA
jgi:hypothetical protein